MKHIFIYYILIIFVYHNASKEYSIMKILSIPIRINTLFLKEETASAPASADFQKVPFIDKSGFSKNLETPFISENLISHPFDKNNKLQKGIHLHFEIPTGFKTAQKLNNDTEETYPPLPNRWLVIKNNSEKWIIESDYLWSENSSEQAKKDSITILLPKKGILGKNVFSRCRHLGRKYPATAFPKAKDGGNYWQNFYGGQGISAIGYGEPTFSGFYPNCKSVFGFHDESGVADDNYEVIGWYEQEADLKAIIEAFSKNVDLKDHLYFNKKKTFKESQKTIKDLGNRWKALKGDEKKEFRTKYEKYIFLFENGMTDFSITDFKKAQ